MDRRVLLCSSLLVLLSDRLVYCYYANLTLQPADTQLQDFRREHPKPIGVWTHDSGSPVEVKETVTLNADPFQSDEFLESVTHVVGERIPERVVHAKGVAAFGYFEVTHDVSKYTKADVFNGIGKKTPLVGRFSIANQNRGGGDIVRENKGLSIKFYTKEGNLDLLCLHVPIYAYRDPINFTPFAHVLRRNPRSNLYDNTMLWDFASLKPDSYHNLLFLSSYYGIPTGYANMDWFPIHAFETVNKHGDRYYVKFNFRTEQGLKFFTSTQAAEISANDPDYYSRELYNMIENKQYPWWRLELFVMTPEDIKQVDYDPFDVTRQWKNGTFKVVQVGRLVFNKNPDNWFRVAEQSAFTPANLVPGIPGPVDILFKGRRFAYKDTQHYRLGRNHNRIEVNLPKYAATYNRDGTPPVRYNMGDTPNYFPNSYNGPIPFVDEDRPKERLFVYQTTAIDFEPMADFYREFLTTDAQRQELADNLAGSLSRVTNPALANSLRLLYLVDPDLGNRTETSLRNLKIAMVVTNITSPITCTPTTPIVLRKPWKHH